MRKADARWILLGCVISDLPWILQRAVRFLSPEFNPYDLRLYCLVQASLLVSLLLAGAFAALSTKPRRTFLILGMGVVLHLLLDATQYKWGNAVHLLAPFSWTSLNFDLFWPEHGATYTLTALGIAGFVLAMRGPWEHPLLAPRRGFAPAVLLFLMYVAGPLTWVDAAEASGTHSIAVLRNVEARAGKEVWIDRGGYADGILTTFAGEEIALQLRVDEPAVVSVRGVFSDPHTMRAVGSHVHGGPSRDLFAYAGLALVALAWLWPALRRRRLA